MALRVQLKVEGGLAHFPGLSRPLTVEEDALMPEDATELRRLVEEARFFDLEPPSPARRVMDAQRTTITVEEGERRRTLEVMDPIEDPVLRALLRHIKASGRKQRGAR
jgi:hypothetical protein